MRATASLSPRRSFRRLNKWIDPDALRPTDEATARRRVFEIEASALPFKSLNTDGCGAARGALSVTSASVRAAVLPVWGVSFGAACMR